MIPTERVLEKLDNHLSQNDYGAARRLLDYWLAEACAEGDKSAELLFYNELMGLCRKLGDRDGALSFARLALTLTEKMGITENVGAATTYLNSATVFKAFGDPEGSIALFEKARDIYEKELSLSDERLGGLYNNMALTLSDLGRFDEAKECFHKAISVMQKSEGKEPEQAITYLNMATSAEQKLGLEGAQEQITELCEKAMALLDIGKDRADGNYAFVCEKCAGVFGYYGYFSYQSTLTERYKKIYERS